MSDDELPPDIDDVDHPIPEGEPIELPPIDNVVAIGEAKKPRRARAPRKPTPDEEAFVAGFPSGNVFEAGSKLALIPAFEKAPIPPELVIPVGYSVTATGELWRKVGKSQALVASSIPLLRRVLTDPQTHEERLEIVFLRRRSWRSAIVERAIISVGGRDTARALGAVGAPIEPNNAKDIAQWIASLERENEHVLPCARVVQRSGWHETEDGDPVFVLGGHVIERGDLESDRVVFDDRGDAGGVTRNMRQHGTEEGQRALIARAIAASDAIAIVVCAALAAPLLERLGAPSFAVHCVGPSSRGKTTGLTVGAGVYGCPEIRGGQGWVSSWDSTSVGLEQRAQLSSDLPLCLDEAGLVSAEQRERDVYMLVGGQGRTRGAARGGLRASTSWRTVVISTGEEELVRVHEAHAGAQVRTIQVRVDGVGSLTGAEVAELGMEARQHYGWLGRAWIAALLEIEDWEPLRLRYRALERELRTVLGERSSIQQRQAEAFAVLALAAELAASLLKLEGLIGAPQRMASDADYRIEILPEWMRALSFVSNLISSEPNAFPELEPAHGGKRVKLVDGQRQQLAARLLGYFDESHGIERNPPLKRALYLVPDPMRERLADGGLSLETVARDWKREGVLVPDSTAKERLRRRVRLGGTNRPWLFVLDLEALNAALGEGPPGSPDGGRDHSPDPSDPSSGSGNASGQQMNLGGGITGRTGITQNEGTPARAGAGARAGARARAHVDIDQGDPSDPSDPSRSEGTGTTTDSSGESWDHSQDHGDPSKPPSDPSWDEEQDDRRDFQDW
jgi:hypothetical protein